MCYGAILEIRKMDKDEAIKKIAEDPDYIKCPKYGNSLVKFLSKNSDGVEDSIIAKLLIISKEKVQEIYEEAIKKLREKLVDKNLK